MLEMRNGFECTDNDCMQCRKSLGNRRYFFIQVVELDEYKYRVVANIEDLTKMSLNDIERAISGYYDDIPAMEESYGIPLGQLDDIIAECSFENRPYDTYDHKSEILTLERAEETIQDFINYMREF